MILCIIFLCTFATMILRIHRQKEECIVIPLTFISGYYVNFDKRKGDIRWGKCINGRMCRRHNILLTPHKRRRSAVWGIEAECVICVLKARNNNKNQ